MIVDEIIDPDVWPTWRPCRGRERPGAKLDPELFSSTIIPSFPRFRRSVNGKRRLLFFVKRGTIVFRKVCWHCKSGRLA